MQSDPAVAAQQKAPAQAPLEQSTFAAQLEPAGAGLRTVLYVTGQSLLDVQKMTSLKAFANTAEFA